MMAKMWRTRGESSRLYDDFRERGVAAIGCSQLAAGGKPNMSRKENTQLYQQIEPNIKLGTAISGASQVWRFINTIQPGDRVASYVSTGGSSKEAYSEADRANVA